MPRDRKMETTWHFRVSDALKAAVKEYADSEDMSCASAVKSLVKQALRENRLWPRRFIQSPDSGGPLLTTPHTPAREPAQARA